MPQVCLVFLAHHADRLRHVRVFDGGADFGNYVDARATAANLRELARCSFLPALRLLRNAARRSGGRIRFAICPSGPLLRAAEAYSPPLLRAMQALSQEGAVEWLGAPWDGSILSIFPGGHLTGQFEAHAREVQRLLGQRPVTAVNTELIYDDHLSVKADAAGMKVVLCGHADRELAGRSGHRVYRAAHGVPVRLIARHAGLSDDWGVRFSDSTWSCHPLKPEAYTEWILDSLARAGGGICPIVLHLADLGWTHSRESGILTFTRRLLAHLEKRGVQFVTPSQVADSAGPLERLDVLSVPQATSGWGPRFDLSPWLGNAMQSNALHLLRKALQRNPSDPAQADALLRLCAADHLSHMRHRDGLTKSPAELPAEERRRPSPFDGPYDAYIDYTNALQHFLGRNA